MHMCCILATPAYLCYTPCCYDRQPAPTRTEKMEGMSEGRKGDAMVDALCDREQGRRIWLSRAAHEAMGSPDAVFLLFDEATQVIGLKTAHPGQKNAYPCAPRGKHGGRRVRALRLCRDFGIYVPHTLFFHASHID